MNAEINHFATLISMRERQLRQIDREAWRNEARALERRQSLRVGLASVLVTLADWLAPETAPRAGVSSSTRVEKLSI